MLILKVLLCIFTGFTIILAFNNDYGDTSDWLYIFLFTLYFVILLI